MIGKNDSLKELVETTSSAAYISTNAISVGKLLSHFSIGWASLYPIGMAQPCSNCLSRGFRDSSWATCHRKSVTIHSLTSRRSRKLWTINHRWNRISAIIYTGKTKNIRLCGCLRISIYNRHIYIWLYMHVYAYLKNMDIQHENGVIYALSSLISFALSLSLLSLISLSLSIYTHACSFVSWRQFAQNLDIMGIRNPK